MSLRIVSGVLSPKLGHQDNGSATIKLREHVVAGDATISGCEFGGSTDYDSEPCKAISIRSFDGQPDSINLNDRFKNNYKEVVIGWKCNGGEIKQITYFFAGEE
jgi:hypothetical protein